MSDAHRPGNPRPDGWLARLAAAFGASAEDPRIALIAEAGDALPPREVALLAAALRFAAMEAGDLAQPRSAVAPLELDMTMPEALHRFALAQCDALPVVGEDTDDPRGAVRLLRLIAAPDAADLTALVEPLPEVPAAMPAPDVLALLDETGAALAVLINEHGGVDGYLSRARLLDALLPAPHRKAGDGGTMDARLPISALEARLGQPMTGLAGDDSETIGGLVFTLLGRVPEPGERVRLPGGASLEVVEVERRRIAHVRVLQGDDTADAA